MNEERPGREIQKAAGAHLPAPEVGPPGTDPAPFPLQLPALPAEPPRLRVLTTLQPQDLVNGFQFLWTFAWVIIDNFILFI